MELLIIERDNSRVKYAAYFHRVQELYNLKMEN
jgi:hypothetical protein